MVHVKKTIRFNPATVEAYDALYQRYVHLDHHARACF